MAAKGTTSEVLGSEIVADAKRYLGIPYKFGGGPQNPRAGLDCSGFVERVAFDLHIESCPRTSEEQYAWAIPVDRTEYGPGDLVFFTGADGEPGNPGHVGIVTGPGRMIDAPHTGSVVMESPFSATGIGVNQLTGFGRMQGSTTSPGSGNPAQNQATQLGEQASFATSMAAGLVIGLMILLGIGILIFLLVRLI